MTRQPNERTSGVDKKQQHPDQAEAKLKMEGGLIVATLMRRSICWVVTVDPNTLWDDVAENDGQLDCLDVHGGPASCHNPMRINAQSPSATREVWLTTENSCWVLVPEPRIEPVVVRALLNAALREEIRIRSITKEFRAMAA